MESHNIKSIWESAKKYTSKISHAHDIAAALTKHQIDIAQNIETLVDLSINDRNVDILQYIIHTFNETSAQHNFKPHLIQAIQINSVCSTDLINAILPQVDAHDPEFLHHAIRSQNIDIVKALLPKDGTLPKMTEDELHNLSEQIFQDNQAKNDQKILKLEKIINSRRDKIKNIKKYNPKQITSFEEDLNHTLTELSTLREKEDANDFNNELFQSQLAELIEIRVPLSQPDLSAKEDQIQELAEDEISNLSEDSSFNFEDDEILTKTSDDKNGFPPTITATKKASAVMKKLRGLI